MIVAAYVVMAFLTAAAAAWIDPDEDPFLLGFYGCFWWIAAPVYLLGCVARAFGIYMRGRK